MEGCTAKQVKIIADSGMESRITKRLRKAGIKNYSIFDARGDDEYGWHSGQMDGDSNILILLLVSDEQLVNLKEVCQYYFARGHHMTVFVSDAQVISKDCP